LEPGSRPVSSLRKRHRAETSAAILDAAEQAIGDEGLHAARMERIAAGAGVSVGTLYNHFEDRDALVQALFESRSATLHELLAEALTMAIGRPVREQVLAMLHAVVVHARAHGRFFTALMAEHLGPSKLRPPAAARAELASCAREVISRGIASGEIAGDPHGIVADALVSLSRLALARALEGRADEPELAALATLFARGAAR
jgi:AcrR family transcriptional regulator